MSMRGNGRGRPILLRRIRSVRYGDQGVNYCVEYVTLELLQCTVCCYLISVPKIQLELSNQGVKLYNEMPNPSAPKNKRQPQQILKTSTYFHKPHTDKTLPSASNHITPHSVQGGRGVAGTSHRLISTSSLHLIIRNLPLFTFATHKLIRRRHLWCRPLCIKNIHLLQLLILLSPFITRHFRTRHGTQSFYREGARYKVLSERGV